MKYSNGMEYLTIAEAAAELGVPERTVRYRVARGLMKGERIGKRVWAIPVDEVEVWKTRGPLPRGKSALAGPGHYNAPY
jgi:excisionase family DNA binding protein